jgi:hypothetical protein
MIADDPTAVLTLGLAIGGNTAVGGEQTSHTGAVWEAIRDHATTFRAAVVSGISARVSLVTGDRALPVSPQRVSAVYFSVLGMWRPAWSPVELLRSE